MMVAAGKVQLEATVPAGWVGGCGVCVWVAKSYALRNIAAIIQSCIVHLLLAAGRWQF